LKKPEIYLKSDFSLSPEAEKELLHFIRYYERKTEGLGAEFLDEVEKSLALIQSFPDLGTLLTETDHRMLVERFPYGIIYTKYENHVMIYAIMPLKRRPGYWKSRK